MVAFNILLISLLSPAAMDSQSLALTGKVRESIQVQVNTSSLKNPIKIKSNSLNQYSVKAMSTLGRITYTIENN